MMDTLLSIRVFCQVAQMRSFTAAAARLGISPAMASKHVTHLEHKLATRLLHRTSRHVSLTEAGRLYLERAQSSLSDLDETAAAIRKSSIRPSGNLLISAPVWMANTGFSEILTGYRQEFPDVLLNIDLSGHEVNIVSDGYDLAFRVSQNISDGLVARQFGRVHFDFVSSPYYFSDRGHPSTFSDLETHAHLAYSVAWPSFRNLLEKLMGEARLPPPVLLTENENLLLHGALNGMGIAYLPRALSIEYIKNGALIPVLQDKPPVLNVSMYAVYSNRNNLAAKTRSFIDFVAHRLPLIL